MRIDEDSIKAGPGRYHGRYGRAESARVNRADSSATAAAIPEADHHALYATTAFRPLHVTTEIILEHLPNKSPPPPPPLGLGNGAYRLCLVQVQLQHRPWTGGEGKAQQRDFITPPTLPSTAHNRSLHCPCLLLLLACCGQALVLQLLCPSLSSVNTTSTTPRCPRLLHPSGGRARPWPF